MISSDLAVFLESGLSIHVATRNARLVPDAVRAMGVRVEPGGEAVTVFLPAATAAAARANLADNGRIAVVFSRPADHRTFQLKGRAESVAPASEADRAVVERYRTALVAGLGAAGVPPAITRRLTSWPAHAVRFRVETIYVQTPGPGAGTPLVAARVSG